MAKARRKKPYNNHVEHEPCEGVPDPSPAPQYAMGEQSFKNAVRAVMLGRGGDAVHAIGLAECKRLGVIPSGRFAVRQVPDGSDNVDLQSVYEWMRRVQDTDPQAVEQLKVLTATAAGRL